MKQIIKNHWKLILIVICLLVIAFLIKKNNQLRSDVLVSNELIKKARSVPETEVPQPPVVEIEKPGGGSLVKQQVITITESIPKEVRKSISESYLKDTIIAALRKENNGKNIEIKNISRLLGEANKKLSEKDLINIAENDSKGILEWKTPHFYSKVDIAAKTNLTKYDIKTDFLQVTESSKGFLGIGLFKKETDYMVGTSPDPDATFNGMLQSRTKIEDRKDAFNFSTEFGVNYFLKPYNPLMVFGGIRLTINPDGKWQPSVSGQYMIDPATGKIQPIVQGKISYTIFE